MTIDIWTGDVSGDWSNGANWSQHAPPGSGDTAELEPTFGTAPFAVTYDGTSSSIAQIIGAASATLIVASGTLIVSGTNTTSTLAGNLVTTGGTLNVGTYFSSTELDVLGSTTLAAGGTDFIAAYGTLLINGGTLAGALPGDSGAIELVGPNAVTIEPGFVANVFDFNLGVDGTASGSNLLLDADLDVTDYLTAFPSAGSTAPTIALNGHTLTIASAASLPSLLGGTIGGPGAVNVAGSADIQALSLVSGASLTAAAGSSVTLSGLLNVASGAAFSDAGIYLSGSALAALPPGVSNASGTAYVGIVPGVRPGVTLQAATGFLNGAIVGSAIIGGGNFFVQPGYSIVNGGLAFGFLQNTIASTTTFEGDDSFAAAVVMTPGSSAAFGPTLALNGHMVAFTGTSDTLAGTISGAGALAVSGAAIVNGLAADEWRDRGHRQSADPRRSRQRRQRRDDRRAGAVPQLHLSREHSRQRAVQRRNHCPGAIRSDRPRRAIRNPCRGRSQRSRACRERSISTAAAL